MAERPEVPPDPYTSNNQEEALEMLQKLKDKAVDFVPRTCPVCGYKQELKHQEFCADCLEKSGTKIPLQ